MTFRNLKFFPLYKTNTDLSLEEQHSRLELISKITKQLNNNKR